MLTFQLFWKHPSVWCGVCVCLCFTSFIITSSESRMWALNFEYKSDQTDFTDWIAFWLADLMEKINPNQQTFCDNT